MLHFDVRPRTFHFKEPAGTSRGVYHTRVSWMLSVTDDDRPGLVGVGECSPLPALSCDLTPDYEERLRLQCDRVASIGGLEEEALRDSPSMLFGIETALMTLGKRHGVIYDNPFTRGEVGIPINGLVWMGSFEEMMRRLEQKINQGYKCVKLKIGAIDFEKELHLIKMVRQRFSMRDVELRLDANGAFSPQEAMGKLETLAAYDIHSIEQPIRQGYWSEMACICRKSPIPIALDEELIGVNDKQRKAALLDTLKPAYIILKPSLHGGMRGTEEWVRMAEERHVGSWITSALESNIGLSAIAQLASHIYGCPPSMPQGLGTGQLFTDNVDMPIEIRGDKLYFIAER